MIQQCVSNALMCISSGSKKQEKEFSKLKIMIESNQIPNFRMFEKSDITM